MKILIIANSSLGTYKFRRELVESLLKKNKVVLCVPYGLHFDDFEKMGCKMIDTPLSRHGKNVFDELALIKKYRQIITDEKPDVVLTFTVKPNFYVPGICRKKKVPCIACVTGLGTPYEKGGITRKVFLKAYASRLKNADAVFFQNSFAKDIFSHLGLKEEKCFSLPGSGVNTDFFQYQNYPEDNGEIVFLFAGRIVKDKGFDEFLRCARAIKEKYPQSLFEVAGEAESEEYAKTVEKARNDGDINFLGYVDDMRPIYKKAWAVVTPSYHEGLSNVCLEAAASGRAVLASDIPGCREIIEDGKTGFLFEAKNGEALAQAVEKFISLPYESKVEMGETGRKKVESEFERKKAVALYEKMIQTFSVF